MNTRLRIMVMGIGILITAVFLNIAARNPFIEDMMYLNPTLFWIGVLTLCLVVGGATWWFTRSWNRPIPTTIPPPVPRPPSAVTWRHVVLGVAIGAVIAGCWWYFRIPLIYLIHLVAVGVLLFGLFRTVTLSAYQPITMITTIAIIALGSMIISQDPLWAYVLLTAIIPLVLAGGFVLAPAGSDADRWTAAASIMSAIFVVLYAVFGAVNLPVGEQVIFSLIGAGIFFVLLPSVRRYLFPRAMFTLTNREWWVVGVLLSFVIIGVIVSFHGTPDLATNIQTAARWLFGSIGLVVLLIIIWSTDRLNKTVKGILTGVVTVLLFWNFLVWVLQGIWSGVQSFQAFVADNSLVYLIGFIVFVVLGIAFAGWARIVRWIWPILFVLIFFATFGLPFGWQWPSSMTVEMPSIERSKKQQKKGPFQDSSTILTVPLEDAE